MKVITRVMLKRHILECIFHLMIATKKMLMVLNLKSNLMIKLIGVLLEER